VSKRGKDTEWDASRGMEEIHEFCFKDFAAVCLFWNFFVSGIPVILLITQKLSMLIAAVPSYYFSIFANFVYCGSHTRLTVPIGPFLCLAMMISEIPFISES
jgi:TM2 domain-containing membrane protein YozV